MKPLSGPSQEVTQDQDTPELPKGLFRRGKFIWISKRIDDNRVEISSPGEPLVPVERFIDGYQSRNERVADIMRRFCAAI